MSDENTPKETAGRAVSFWMSHDEIERLGQKAAEEKVSRNEACRRAVRSYVG